MAERTIFTWNLDLESFNEIMEQPNLLDLRSEFEMRGNSLSRSLLIWEKDGVANNWSLSDIGNEKFYHVVRRSDTETEMEVLEEDWDSAALRIPPLSYSLHGTHEGLVDWLKLVGLDISDLETLKRTDLSERKRDFEIVYDDLLAAYELLRRILISSRESLLGLSSDDVQKIRTSLEKFWKTIGAVKDVGLSTSKDRYTEILQETFVFCNEVKELLLPTVAYLEAKEAGQFDPQALEQLETQVRNITDKVLEGFKEENNLSHESTKQDVEEIRDGLNQLNTKFENEIAKEGVSKHKDIFKKQANEHQKAAQGWLRATGGLIVVFGAIFYFLFESLKLGGTELIGVLQNVFTKGFLLTLIYFILNRSVKNYAAQKHLEVVNRHRQNALDTFDEFLDASGDNQETRDAVLLAATNAIFDANQSGYLSAKMKGSESTNPFQQVFKAVMPNSSKPD